MEPERVVGIKSVTHNEPFFQGHFPDFPVMPGVLIVEAMAQTAGVLVLKSMEDRSNKLVLLVAVENARFRRPVVPGDTLRMEMKVIKRKASVAKMAGVATVDGVVVAEAEVMCKLADKEEKQRRRRLSDADPPDRHRGPGGAHRGKRRDRAVLDRRRGSGDRRPHPPDGQHLPRRPHLDRRGQRLLPVQHRRRGVAGPEIQGRARRDAHRPPQPHPRIRHHPSRHRRAAAWSPASAATTC